MTLRARALFAQADALAPGSAPLLYEAYGAALDLRDDELARFALDRLLGLDLQPDERAALVHHRYELGDAADRLALVDAELTRGEASGSAPEIPRAALTQAAQAREYARLAQLHEALAAASDDSDAKVAEQCAAARAWVRAGEPARARTLLVSVLEQEPAQRYALTLLEEVMRTQGDAAGAIELLRAAAAQRESARDTELHLLAAGAAAESAGEFEAAAASYREAASAGDGRQAGSYGALWALLQLARRRGDSELERSAREALVAREEARGRGAVETLLLAEHLDLVEQQPAAAQARLARALGDEDVGHHAAIALALSRTAPLEMREQALELLATRATDSLRPALLRQLGGELIAHSGRPARVLDLAERVSVVRPDDRWAIWTRTHTRLSHQDDDASALESLAAITTDPQVADAARAEALWARQLAAPEQPLDAALEALPPTPDELGVELGPELAAVVAAVASPAHDAALRAQALDRLARDAEPELRPAALLALARAQLAQEDDVAAIETIEELLRLEPSSLAGWELAYVAARRRAHATLLAAAAEQLAALLEGEEALALLEEAADIHIDQLDDLPEAERLLGRALALEPTRARAYARLHECLVQRGDEAGLIALVRKRTTLIDDPEALLALYYELARRERKRGQIDAAFDAVDHALMLDDEHVGALALLADIHTARGDFAAAVGALERLAKGRDLPATQRRLALLGAADFLENRLADREGALARLEQLVEREPDDPKLALRVADLCERMGKEEGRTEDARRASLQRAAIALSRAVELEQSVGARVALGLRLGDLLRDELAQKEAAAEWYARVLAWSPDQLAAARAHFAITADRAQLERTEQALRSRAQAAPRSAEPLRKLASLAAVTDDRALAHVALAALSALGDVRDDERAAWEESQRRVRALRIEAGRTLTDHELADLLTPPLEPHANALARAVFAAAAELDDLTPARFGVGRGQRVSAKEPSALRDELRALVGAVGETLDELYVGGSAATGVAALPRNGQLSFVLGPKVESPLAGSARHAVALQIAGAHLQTLPLLVRGARDGARLLWAAIAAEELPLPRGARRDDLGDLPRTVSKALPRRTRRSLAELIRALPDGGDGLVAHCSSALAYTRRLALALSGELEAALEEAGADGEEALDLFQTWTSAALSASRRKLGLAP